MSYTELAAQYDLTETAFEIACTRVFIDDDNGATVTLPVMLESLEPAQTSIYYNTRVWQINKKKYGGHPNKVIYTYSYSNDPSKWTMGSDTTPGLLPTTGSVGGDMISVDNKTAEKFTWNSDHVVIQQSIPIVCPNCPFKLTKRVSNLTLEKWIEYAGTINSTAFTGPGGTLFAQKTVLFNGVNFEEYKDNVGNRMWKVDFNFEYKAVGWLFLYRDTAASFELVLPDMYEQTDLNKLF